MRLRRDGARVFSYRVIDIRAFQKGLFLVSDYLLAMDDFTSSPVTATSSLPPTPHTHFVTVKGWPSLHPSLLTG